MIEPNRPEKAMAFLGDVVRIITTFGESAHYNATCLSLGSKLMKRFAHEHEALTLFRQR